MTRRVEKYIESLKFSKWVTGMNITIQLALNVTIFTTSNFAILLSLNFLAQCKKIAALHHFNYRLSSCGINYSHHLPINLPQPSHYIFPPTPSLRRTWLNNFVVWSVSYPRLGERTSHYHLLLHPTRLQLYPPSTPLSPTISGIPLLSLLWTLRLSQSLIFRHTHARTHV